MLTETEIDSILQNQELKEEVYELKKRFIKEEAPYLEISDEDFLGLLILSPSIKISLADGTISFFEEQRLKRKARMFCKGKFQFFKKDPISIAMPFLVKNFRKWEKEFLDVLKDVLVITLRQNKMFTHMLTTADVSSQDLTKDLLNAPNLLSGAMASMFVNRDEELIKSKNISKNQYNAIKEIGHALELDKLPMFGKFVDTYSVK